MWNATEEGTAPGLTGDLATVAEVLDRASVPVGLLQRSGVVVYTNESFARACGRPAGELVGAVLANSVVADDRMGLHAGLEILTDRPDTDPDAETPVSEVRFVGADGRVRAARLNLGLLTGDLASALTEHDTPDDTGLVLCIATDRSEERRSERSDRRARVTEATAAMTDPATGLLNTRGIELATESASRRAGRHDSAFAVIHCVVEATGGTASAATDGAEGDPETREALLMACAERIRQRLRPADTVARSGDVIVVVAEDLEDEQDAAGVTYRVLSTVIEPVPTEDGPVAVQMHAGTVVADGSTPVHKLAGAATEASALAHRAGGFEMLDMRRT